MKLDLLERLGSSLRPRGTADLQRIAVAALVGAFAGWLAIPAPLPAVPLGEVTLDGKPLHLAGRPAMLAEARAIAKAYVSGEVTIAASQTRIIRTRADLGARVDAARLEALVDQLTSPRSPLRRFHRGTLALPLPVTLDGARSIETLTTVKDDLDRAAVDARIDLAEHRVIGEEDGRRVDVYATAARLDAALTKGASEIDAVVETVKPARTAASIANVVVDDVLGFFETKYNADRKHADRTFNLRLAASKLDGQVVMPGEVFDFNEVVGPRSEANGYKVATVIASGELVDGIGGGTCQVAGTLHGAAYFAGLEIVERKPHTRPSFYIKMGMDATVVYPTITLRLKNTFPHPIVLHETVENGIVRAEILGPKRTRDVVFVRKIEEVVPFTERESPDPTVPVGERVLAQRGIPGFKILRTRTVRDGEDVTRDHDTDVYPPTAQIWRVGTGPADLKLAAVADEHPEYVADEILTIAQGPNIEDPHPRRHVGQLGGPMVESRVAGRYGTHGWTAKQGFARPRMR